ncbi:hypothetical protein CHLNCDRAFT_56485 [Chlorella variabilis]|uniref:Exostosin GT47 domain-containing protein n=1 Tax=Chlorella variabilis TaxID=554065 RepID=E1Z2C8_CHLVA|nr:hypothetical protein CHLNCDRAFT_56485 [Chlorella variabilis]EFN59979.1 hypothetical protein CHLNCDRAFT_56485 [Chlorella variabilis]|eukprot:XP_005852081.1 hypothetical protein CHLNCDRAFT_56485 [Chlorella variabilis]
MALRRPARRGGLKTAAVTLAIVLVLGCIALLYSASDSAHTDAPRKVRAASASASNAFWYFHVPGRCAGMGAHAPSQRLGTLDEATDLAEKQEQQQQHRQQARTAAKGRRWGAANPGQLKGAVPEAIKQRCALTLGTWCVDYLTQKGVPAVTAPRGSKTCSMNCNKASGISVARESRSGWRGFNCIHPAKRFCTHTYRQWGFEPQRMPPNLPNTGADPNSMPYSRCAAGYCDETVAACYCPSNTTYGRVPAPEDAPMDAPPQRHGRPLHADCQPNNFLGGTREPDEIFGPEGWCMSAQPKIQCGCNAPDWTYAFEPGFLEMLMQSEHRTLDAEEADFFYVPVFTSCFIWPVRDGADSLYDFFYSVGHNRVQGATNMLLEAFHWIQSHQPWWERRGGRDHIWLVTHDEGSCWVPAAIRPSIILSHWGRTDLNHSSLSGYHYMDSYSLDNHHAQASHVHCSLSRRVTFRSWGHSHASTQLR